MNKEAKDPIPFDNRHAAKTLKEGVFAPPYPKERPQNGKASGNGK